VRRAANVLPFSAISAAKGYASAGRPESAARSQIVRRAAPQGVAWQDHVKGDFHIGSLNALLWPLKCFILVTHVTDVAA
jgi:hypothetical protein